MKKRVKKGSYLVFVLLFVFVMPGAASGEAKAPAPEKAVTLEEVVVTATKMPEKRRDIPNAVVIVDKDDLQASGAGSLGELLANEPGIDWKSYGNYGGASQEIHLRGMRGKATQVFINGVNVNSPSLGVADVNKIPLENIERVEVVKGSGSLLYGSGAMGGTVSVMTKRPKRDKMDLKVAAGYGSQNTYRLSAQQGMFVAGDFGYYLTAGRRETDGFRANSHLRQTDASLKLVLDKKDLIDISLYGDYIDRQYGMPGVKPPAGTRDYSIGGLKFYNSEAANLLDNSSDKDGRVILEVKGRPLKWFGYNLKGYYTNMENYNYERYASNATGAENWITNKVTGTDGHVDIRPFEGASMLLGGEYKDFDWKNDQFSLNAAGSRTTFTSNKAHLYTRGFFAEAQYRPSAYFKALAGFRHENHSAFGSENLPLFGLVINPTAQTAVKINHGKHFLAPTPNDLYWPVGPFVRGNTALKPEIGWHTDVTLEQSLLEDRLFVTMSYFRWNVDNKIQWEPDTQGVWNPINLAGYKADGLEMGTRIGPFNGVTLSLSYTYINAEEENRQYTRQDYGWPPFLPPDFQFSMVKRRAAMTPNNQFKGEITYRSGFGLTATATARYVGDRVVYRTESTVYPETKTVKYVLNDYWTADLKLEQRLYKHWIVSLAVNNLFDAKYDTRLSTFTDRTTSRTTMSGYPAAGASVFARVAYEF